jgi:hypothetical protein
MPVYATEPSAAERAAAEALLGGTDGTAVRIPAPRVTV